MATINSNAVPVQLEPMRGFHQSGPGYLMPPGSGSDMRNVIVHNGQVTTSRGWRRITDVVFGPQVLGLFQFFRTPFTGFDPLIIVEKDLVSIWNPDDGNRKLITPSPFPQPDIGPGFVPPQGAIDMNGNFILVNGRGVFVWAPGLESSTIAPDPMERLNGLDHPDVGIRGAYAVGVVGPKLLLGRLSTQDGIIPNRIWYSDDNDSTTWKPGFDEETETASTAGFFDIPPYKEAETPHIFSILRLRDFGIVYTGDSVWTIEYVGAPLQYVVRLVQVDFGLMTTNSVVNFGDRHYLYANDGQFYEFNGLDKQPIGDRIKDWVKSRVTGDVRAFRQPYPDRACWYFSTTSSTWKPDTAVFFDPSNGEWTIEDFPFNAALSADSSCIDGSLVATTTIDELTGTIDALTGDIDSLSASTDRDTSRPGLPAEILGPNDDDNSQVHIFVRDGYTKAALADGTGGSVMTAYWESQPFQPTVDAMGQPQLNHRWAWTGFEAFLGKAPIVDLNEDPPDNNYDITVTVKALRDRVQTIPVQTVSKDVSLRGAATCLTRRVRAHSEWAKLRVEATSDATQARPWALSGAQVFGVPRGQAKCGSIPPVEVALDALKLQDFRDAWTRRRDQLAADIELAGGNAFIGYNTQLWTYGVRLAAEAGYTDPLNEAVPMLLRLRDLHLSGVNTIADLQTAQAMLDIGNAPGVDNAALKAYAVELADNWTDPGFTNWLTWVATNDWFGDQVSYIAEITLESGWEITHGQALASQFHARLADFGSFGAKIWDDGKFPPVDPGHYHDGWDTSHSNRHMRMAYKYLRAGTSDIDLTDVTGMAQLLANHIWNGRLTTSDVQAGINGGLWISNYIDGVDTNYRDYTFTEEGHPQDGTFGGMNSQLYYGWGIAGGLFPEVNDLGDALWDYDGEYNSSDSAVALRNGGKWFEVAQAGQRLYTQFIADGGTPATPGLY